MQNFPVTRIFFSTRFSEGKNLQKITHFIKRIIQICEFVSIHSSKKEKSIFDLLSIFQIFLLRFAAELDGVDLAADRLLPGVFFGVSESILSPPISLATEFSSVELMLGVADDVVLSAFLLDPLEFSEEGLSVFLLDPLLALSVVDLSVFLFEPVILSLKILSLALLDPLPVSEIDLSVFFVEPLTDESDAGLSDFLPLSDATEAEKGI